MFTMKSFDFTQKKIIDVIIEKKNENFTLELLS